MNLKPFKKDAGGYGNLDMANQHESDKETPIRLGSDGKKEESETYIGLPARNGKNMTLNKIQHTNVGDDIHFYVNGVENRGVVVKMGGTYISVFKEDGNIHEIPIDETFFVKDILINKTWDDMSGEERTELLQNARAYSPRFLNKNWDELPRELKTVLSEKSEGFKKLKPVYEGDTEQAEKATGMEQNHDKDNLEKEEANHAVTGYAQTQQNTLGKIAPVVGAGLGAAVGAGVGRAAGAAVGSYAGKKLAEHRGDKNPTRGRHPKKSLFDDVEKDSISGEVTGGRPQGELPQSHAEQAQHERIRGNPFGISHRGTQEGGKLPKPSKPFSDSGSNVVIGARGEATSDQPVSGKDEERPRGSLMSVMDPRLVSEQEEHFDPKTRTSEGKPKDYRKPSTAAGSPRPSKGAKKGIDGTLKAILELKSDVEEGRYGNAGSTAEVGVSTDTALDVTEGSGYEERPHVSLEEVGEYPRTDAKTDHHANEISEPKSKHPDLEPKFSSPASQETPRQGAKKTHDLEHAKEDINEHIKEMKKKGEDGQTGSINTSEGGAFNPIYNAYDTPITPEETKTGRKISGRDQIKKGVPLSNVNTWGIKYVTKENIKKDDIGDYHSRTSDIEGLKAKRPDLNFRQTGKPCAHCGKQGWEVEVQNPDHDNKDWFSLAGTDHQDRDKVVCPTCDAKQTRGRGGITGGVNTERPKGGE